MFTTPLFNSCITYEIKKIFAIFPLDELFGSIIEEFTTKEDFIRKFGQSTFVRFERYGF
jgi:hypothetical protein